MQDLLYYFIHKVLLSPKPSILRKTKILHSGIKELQVYILMSVPLLKMRDTGIWVHLSMCMGKRYFGDQNTKVFRYVTANNQVKHLNIPISLTH